MAVGTWPVAAPGARLSRGVVVAAGLAALLVWVAALPQEHAPRAFRLPGALTVLTPADGLGAVSGGWGDAWLDDRWSEHLLRVDHRTGNVVARIPVEGRMALSAGAGAVWALQSGGGYGRGLRGPLLRIDPARNRVMDRMALRTPTGEAVLGFGVLARGDSVWVWGPDELLRFDSRTDRLAQLIPLPDARGETTGFALVDGAPVITTADGHLVRFDPHTGEEVATVSLPLTPPVLQQAIGSRVVLTAPGTVAALDLRSGRLLWRRGLGYRISTVVEAGGVLWANGARIRDPGDRVWELDPDTGATLGSALLPEFGSASLAVIDGTVWVTITRGRVVVLRRPATPLRFPQD